jgi:hypothetical protein
VPSTSVVAAYAAAHQVDVVEPVAQDRDAGRDGQRGERQRGEHADGAPAVPEDERERQDHGRDAGGEREPLELLALDAPRAAEARDE